MVEMAKARVRVEDLLRSDSGALKRRHAGRPVYVAERDGSVKEVRKLYKKFGGGVTSTRLDQRVSRVEQLGGKMSDQE